jgi:hypothetical protein
MLNLYHLISIGLIVRDKNDLFPKNPFSIRRMLRAAHPSSNALLFFAINDTCIKNQCGYDIYLLEYIAEKLNMDLRYRIF